MSPDLKARQVLMSAHLYYDRDSPILSDAEFDALCLEVFEDWDELSEFRQWQLGEDPVDIVTTACHVFITEATVGGAEAWHIEKFGHAPEKPYRFNEKGTKDGARFATISG